MNTLSKIQSLEEERLAIWSSPSPNRLRLAQIFQQLEVLWDTRRRELAQCSIPRSPIPFKASNRTGPRFGCPKNVVIK